VPLGAPGSLAIGGGDTLLPPGAAPPAGEATGPFAAVGGPAGDPPGETGAVGAGPWPGVDGPAGSPPVGGTGDPPFDPPDPASALPPAAGVPVPGTAWLLALGVAAGPIFRRLIKAAVRQRS